MVGSQFSSENIQQTLVRVAKPKMSPKDLMSKIKRAHPYASRKEILHAAFASVIAIVDRDPDKAMALHEFALKERNGGEVD